MSGILSPQERQEFARQGGPDGVEPWEMLAKRAFWTINKLADACPESTIAVVSHGAWINALLAVVSGHEHWFWQDPAEECMHQYVVSGKKISGR